MQAEPQWPNAVLTAGHTTTWRELASAANDHWELPDDPQRRRAFVTGTDYDALTAIAHLVAADGDGLVIGSDRLTTTMRSALETAGFDILEAGADGANSEVGTFAAGRIAIFTSGTTGDPKLIEHTWDTLNTMGGLENVTPRRWLVPYVTGTYAWYQLVSLSLFVPGQGLVVADATDPRQFFAVGAQHRATAISSTPTMWRFALAAVSDAELRALPLQQISLGGEIVDQQILDELRRLYPTARISHIYASTEVGACIVVNDGTAGFPKAWLGDAAAHQFALRIVNDCLQVQTRFAAVSATRGEDGWIETGDRVEIRDDRVYFVGRADDSMINVGGSKAYPAVVESVLLSHPSVRWARVRAKRAPLMGHLAVADVVLRDDANLAEAEAELTMFAGDELPDYAVPRFWTFLDEIPMAVTLKTEQADQS